jgi:hypothetical protein
MWSLLEMKTSSNSPMLWGSQSQENYDLGYRSAVHAASRLSPEGLKQLAEFNWGRYEPLLYWLWDWSIWHTSQPVVIDGKFRAKLLPTTPPPPTTPHAMLERIERMTEMVSRPEFEVTEAIREAVDFSYGFIGGINAACHGRVDDSKLVGG